MRPPCPPCRGDCKEGRACDASAEITRQVLSRVALHQSDGGRRINTRSARSLLPSPTVLARIALAARIAAPALLLSLAYAAAVVYLYFFR